MSASACALGPPACSVTRLSPRVYRLSVRLLSIWSAYHGSARTLLTGNDLRACPAEDKAGIGCPDGAVLEDESRPVEPLSVWPVRWREWFGVLTPVAGGTFNRWDHVAGLLEQIARRTNLLRRASLQEQSVLS